MSSKWHVDIEAEASSRNIREDTLKKLRRSNYDTIQSLADITSEQLEKMGLSTVQRGILRDWIVEIRRASDPAAASTSSRGHPEHKHTIIRRRTALESPNPRSGEGHTARDKKRIGKEGHNIQGFMTIMDDRKRDKSAERQEQLTEELVELSVHDLCDIIDESVMNFMESEVNIAVCGRSGTGKSSLINCILNMTASEAGAAGVDIVECTTDPVAYKHPAIPGVLIWDLPGVGTERYSKSNYLDTVEFSRFDAYIIVCSKRIYEDDTWLAAEAEECGKPFYFVRSQIDIDVQNTMRDRQQDEQTAVDIIRKNAQDSLVKCGLSTSKIYLVSSVLCYQSKWDFPRLMEQLIKHTPEKNVTAMVMAMVSCSSEIIMKKKLDFAKRINAKAIEAAKPESNFKDVILGEINLYVERFGVTDADMKKWQVEIERLEPKLKGIKQNLVTLIQSLDKEKVQHFFWRLANSALFQRFAWAKRLAKVTEKKFLSIGYKATTKAEEDSAELIKQTTCETLQTSLNECVELAFGVLSERNKVTIPEPKFLKL